MRLRRWIRWAIVVGHHTLMLKRLTELTSHSKHWGIFKGMGENSISISLFSLGNSPEASRHVIKCGHPQHARASSGLPSRGGSYAAGTNRICHFRHSACFSNRFPVYHSGITARTTTSWCCDDILTSMPLHQYCAVLE